MATRWGLGPVFANEWLTVTRRWQVYAHRSMFVGVLLLGLASVWASRRGEPTIGDLAEIGGSFFRAIVFTQLTLVVLAAPASTAGAICREKASGNLGQMLATDLSDAEIVLGKLAARLLPVTGLVCCALPVLALSSLLGGIDPMALTGVFLIAMSVAVLGCTLALVLSIWGTKPYEVLLAVYAFDAIWLLSFPTAELFTWLWNAPPLPDWTIATHPFILALAPYNQPGLVGPLSYVAHMSVTLGLSALLLVVSIGRMRGVLVAQAGRSETVALRAAWRMARAIAGGQPRCLVRMASQAAVALDQGPDPVLLRPGHRLHRAGDRRQHPPWNTAARLAAGLCRGVPGRARPATPADRGGHVAGRGTGAGEPRRPPDDADIEPEHRPGEVVGSLPGDAATARFADDPGTRSGLG